MKLEAAADRLKIVLLRARVPGPDRTADRVVYASKLNRLMNFPAVASARVDTIDEGVIERYVVFRRKLVGPATVNRELATLRRILRLAHEWKEIDRVPLIRLLGGERNRDFVLSRTQEKVYLEACPQPLKDIATLMLETGLRIGEALSLEWPDVRLEPLSGSRFGYFQVREGKSKNARRTIPLTDRAAVMLRDRVKGRISEIVFANEKGKRYLGTSINHLHRDVAAPLENGKRRPIFGADFVLLSLRHTMLTRLGESGVDAFTIMRIAGHSSMWSRSDTCTRGQRPSNAPLSGCNCMATGVCKRSLQFSLQSGSALL